MGNDGAPRETRMLRSGCKEAHYCHRFEMKIGKCPRGLFIMGRGIGRLEMLENIANLGIDGGGFCLL